MGKHCGTLPSCGRTFRLRAVDVAGAPEKYPPGCEFQRADLERERLPWPDSSMSAITCMHLVEHFSDAEPLMREAAPAPAGRQNLFRNAAPQDC